MLLQRKSILDQFCLERKATLDTMPDCIDLAAPILMYNFWQDCLYFVGTFFHVCILTYELSTCSNIAKVNEHRKYVNLKVAGFYSSVS